MAAVMTVDSTSEMLMDKLTYDIFSVLENKFLFGGYAVDSPSSSFPQTPVKVSNSGAGKVRVLSIDGGIIGASADGLLAGAALAQLESSLRSCSGDPTARIADFFDLAAGSGAGGVLAAMLFTRGPDGRPLFSADEALRFLAKNRRAVAFAGPKKGLLKGIFGGKSSGIFRRTFGDSTLRDAVKPVLIPCYDLSTAAPFVFSRADAMESDGFDFKMSEVCAATCAADRAVETIRSVDGKTGIVAIGGGVAMANPTAAAITHVLNNKQEFPFANGVEDLLVVSFGTGGADSVPGSATPSRAELLTIAGSSMADTVDQAVAAAFGLNFAANYVRVQPSGLVNSPSSYRSRNSSVSAAAAEEMLSHRNVESVLFRGKKVSELSNAQKLEQFAEQLVKEQARRNSAPIPTVFIKQAMTPRLSSATTCTSATTSISTSSSQDSY